MHERPIALGERDMFQTSLLVVKEEVNRDENMVKTEQKNVIQVEQKGFCDRDIRICRAH
jgi:hypothetical protein